MYLKQKRLSDRKLGVYEPEKDMDRVKNSCPEV